MLSNQKFLAVFLATLISFGVTSTAANTQKSNIKIAKFVNLDVLDEVTANSDYIETLSTTSQNLIKKPESINNYSKLINNDFNSTDIILNIYKPIIILKLNFKATILQISKHPPNLNLIQKKRFLKEKTLQSRLMTLALTKT